MLGLDALTVEVALTVQHRLGRARGAAREGDQAGVGRRQLDRRRRLTGEQALVGGVHERVGVHPGGDELRRVALVGHDEARAGHPQSQLQVPGAQLLATGQDDGAEAKAGAHRQHPLGPVADDRHDDVARSHSAARQLAGQARPAPRDLPAGPRTPASVARELHQCEVAARGGVEDVAGEVAHRTIWVHTKLAMRRSAAPSVGR